MTRPAHIADGADAPPRAARAVEAHWRRLAHPAVDARRFDPAAVAGLPLAAQRYLTHAIAPGCALHRAVELRMHGQIRLGTWRPFRARQVLAPGTGYVWAARAEVAGLPVVGYDRCSDGTAEMRWKLCGLVPVVSAGGPDITRSAAGRLAGEGVLVPTAGLEADWTATDDPDRVTVRWTSSGETEAVALHLRPDGGLRSVTMQRWGEPLGMPAGRYPFGVQLGDDAVFDGITIPTTLRAAWCWGTPREQDGEFFRATITAATWR